MWIAQAAIARSNLAGHNPIVVGASIPLSVLISFLEKYGQIPNTWIFGIKEDGSGRVAHGHKHFLDLELHQRPWHCEGMGSSVSLPQVVERNTPRSLDVVEEYLL
jgi:hypothetical protein